MTRIAARVGRTARQLAEYRISVPADQTWNSSLRLVTIDAITLAVKVYTADAAVSAELVFVDGALGRENTHAAFNCAANSVTTHVVDGISEFIGGQAYVRFVNSAGVGATVDYVLIAR